MATLTSRADARPRRALRPWLLWTAGFIAFPIAGVAGTAAGGPLDSATAAVLGGVATGAVLGLGQSLASSGRLAKLRWTAATALGMSLGLLLGSYAVDFGTTATDLAVMGASTGAVLGVAQALALPSGTRRRWTWALAMPLLWAVGWVVSTVVVGIAVDEQFTIFGAGGAVTVTALLGALLHTLVPVHLDPTGVRQ